MIVTHDARTAATADRMISMRDGQFVDDVLFSGDSRTTAQILNVGSRE